jgi:Ca2+-binding EF-hand superfamily protein
MNKAIILSGAALIAIAGAAFAQSPEGTRRGPPADVTRQQAIERADQMFARMDANHDGRFTRDEARQGMEQRRAERAGRMFDRLDINHDGNISREEFGQARAQHRRGRGGEGMAGGPGMRGHRPGPGGPDGPGGPGMHGQQLFGEQGFITRDQFRERALGRFDRLDADHNGIVTVAERQAARGEMRRRMEAHPDGAN